MGKGGESKSLAPVGIVPISADEIRVDNKIYSADALANSHPGGDLFVKAFAGRDASEAFMSYHRKPFPHTSQSNHLLRDTETKTSAASDVKGMSYLRGTHSP